MNGDTWLRCVVGLPTAKWLTFLAGCLVALGCSMPASGQTVIDFENLQTSVTVLNQYANQGVTFNGPLARDYSQSPGFAHSGTKAIELCFAAEFCTTPLIVSFTTAQKHVKVWVGYSSPLSQATTVVMQALDQNGAMVSQTSAVLPASNTPIPVQTPLEINIATPAIVEVLVTLSSVGGIFNNSLVIDDVEFDTTGSAPPCTTQQAPLVALTEPPNGEVVQVNLFTLQGAVLTPIPLDTATMTVTNGGVNTTTDLLSELLSRNGGNLGPISVFDSLTPGTNTVTVTATDCFGSVQQSRTVLFNPIAPGTRFKVLGMEVNQVTQDVRDSVPLVAGKPTLIRVYLSLEGPTTVINGVAGQIVATKPGQATPFGVLNSSNSITVTSNQNFQPERLDLTASLNFVLPPDWYAYGTLHFEISNLSMEGQESSLPCDGCNLDQLGIPYWFPFQPTRPLKLILAPYIYSLASPPVSADILFGPMGILQWVNNVYPLGGSFPGEGSGIDLLRILPMQATGRDLHTGDGGDDFISDLDGVLSDLQDQSDFYAGANLLAMLPCGCGGKGEEPGSVAYADTWAPEHGLIPIKNFEFYGSYWAHELGHNFGRDHAGDSHGEAPPQDLSFPYLHGSIGEPGLATTTEWWNSTPFIIPPGIPVPAGPYPHAHDFMSYGLPNDSAEHTFSWISPYTYEAIFTQLEQVARAVAPSRTAPAEKLLVGGLIRADGKVTLRPFRIATTAFESGRGKSGEYTLELLGNGGRILLEYHFDAHRLSESKSLGFSEYVPWKSGTRTIVLKGKPGVLAKREVSAHKPWVRVISPAGGELWGNKAIVSWEAGHDDKEALTFTVLYNDGQDKSWIPLAEGLTKSSVTVDAALLPGSTKARIRVRATDGVNTSEAESNGVFTVPVKKPLVAILSPAQAEVLAPGAETVFLGGAYDVKDGLLSGANLTWTSDRDGLLGRGQRIKARGMSRGSHVITLTATDKDGNSASARVSVVIGRERLSPTKIIRQSTEPSAK